MRKPARTLALVPMPSAPSPAPAEALIVHQRVSLLVPTLLRLLLSRPLPAEMGMRDRLLMSAAANVAPNLAAQVATFPPTSILHFVDCLMLILHGVRNTDASEDEYNDVIAAALADLLADGEPQPA